MAEGQGTRGHPQRGYAAMLEICRALASPYTERELINSIIETICRTFDVEVCSLRLLDEFTGDLVLTASRGMEGYSKPLRVGESVVGRAVLHRKPYVIEDLSDSPYKNTDYVTRRGLQSLMSVPLVLRDKAVGGLTAYSTILDNFSRDDVHLLGAIASQIAAVLENRRLVRDTVSTLVSLARAIEAKDPYTQGHSERVTAYAVMLAERVGVPGQDLALLKQIGPMHDIGKIGISDAILHKPARLSPSEWKVMHRHPEIGEQIVNSIRSFQGGLFLIRSHHEDIAGTGYPDRLSGNQIPLTARIMRIADSYDAMTTQRPYRDPRQHEAAIEELTAYAGTQFDEELVHEFCALASERELPMD